MCFGEGHIIDSTYTAKPSLMIFISTFYETVNKIFIVRAKVKYLPIVHEP